MRFVLGILFGLLLGGLLAALLSGQSVEALTRSRARTGDPTSPAGQ